MFPLAARMTGDCDEEQSVISHQEPSKHIFNFGGKLREQNLPRHPQEVLPVIRNLVHYMKKTHKQAQEEHKKLYLKG
jgi:hypothetical protein